MKRLSDRSYFFDEGIYFECQSCGSCCTGSRGSVYVDNNEISKISEYLRMPLIRFIQKYLFPFRDSFSIRDDPEGRCFFYKDKCVIYPVRPLQCKAFPFWFDTLRSEKRWKEITANCPGIGCGRLYSKGEILSIVGSTIQGTR
jgi:Fe-S-cluster containining protein